MVKSRNSYEQKLMRQSGKIAASALKKALDSVKVGVTQLEVDKITEEEIYKLGGDLSYKTVPNYNFATCITVNEEVVHGIPTERKFEKGDLVSIDLAVMFKGWHTDTAWTILIGQDLEKEKFLKVGEDALWDGIGKAVAGNKVGDISHAIQSRVEGAGYKVVRSLVGHGVGKSLHEDPEVPGYGKPNTGLTLKARMSIAIEVIYSKSSSEVTLEEDGWTYSTADKSISGLFEMTVIVGSRKAEILTDLRSK